MIFQFSKKAVRFILILWLTACGSESYKMPIQKDKLKAVLIDVHLAESIIESETQHMKDSLAALYYPQIFEKHGVQSKDFDSTLSFLHQRPILMRDIYDEVIKDIEKITKPMADTTSKN